MHRTIYNIFPAPPPPPHGLTPDSLPSPRKECTGVRYVITKCSRMDSYQIFLPMKLPYTRFARAKAPLESQREPLKKGLVWLTGGFLREHVAVNSRCAKVRSLQYFKTLPIIVLFFLVGLRINNWKENFEILNNYPFWEKTQNFICFCQLTMNEKVLFVASCKYSQQRLRSRWALFICDVFCHVNLLARTVFENIGFLFFYIN